MTNKAEDSTLRVSGYLENCVDLRDIQELLGHKRYKTTEYILM